jgi:hypothetical protein
MLAERGKLPAAVEESTDATHAGKDRPAGKT